MKLENQVASLGPSKKLAELGVRSVDSLFFYMDCGGMNYLRYRDTTNVNPLDTLYPAYTVAELGEMFSLSSMIGDDEMNLLLAFDIATGNHFQSITQAIELMRDPDKLALMLIYLIEHGRVTVEEINNA
jgi:hypothetical protein